MTSSTKPEVDNISRLDSSSRWGQGVAEWWADSNRDWDLNRDVSTAADSISASLPRFDSKDRDLIWDSVLNFWDSIWKKRQIATNQRLANAMHKSTMQLNGESAAYSPTHWHCTCTMTLWSTSCLLGLKYNASHSAILTFYWKSIYIFSVKHSRLNLR